MIPEAHQDLLINPVHGVLTTMMPDGQPQMSIVWVDYDGTYVLINTAAERQKSKNMLNNPLVNVLVIDPQDGGRFLEIRGEAIEMTTAGAIAHADKLAQAYSSGRKQRFYGDVYAPEREEMETRVIFKIRPVKVITDAVFN